jgi:hypothetical protein
MVGYRYISLRGAGIIVCPRLLFNLKVRSQGYGIADQPFALPNSAQLCPTIRAVRDSSSKISLCSCWRGLCDISCHPTSVNVDILQRAKRTKSDPNRTPLSNLHLMINPQLIFK